MHGRPAGFPTRAATRLRAPGGRSGVVRLAPAAGAACRGTVLRRRQRHNSRFLTLRAGINPEEATRGAVPPDSPRRASSAATGLAAL